MKHLGFLKHICRMVYDEMIVYSIRQRLRMNMYNHRQMIVHCELSTVPEVFRYMHNMTIAFA